MPSLTTVFDALERRFREKHAITSHEQAIVAHDAITEHAGGSWSVVRMPGEDRPAADGDPLVYNPDEVIASLRSKDYYGTDATNALMEQAANLLESIWAERNEPRPMRYPITMLTLAVDDEAVVDAETSGSDAHSLVSDFVPLDDERLQAIADLTQQARKDAEWRRTVTSALVGYNSSSLVTATAAEGTIRANRRAAEERGELSEAIDRIGDLLPTYQLRAGMALYFADGTVPTGPVFTSPLARDVYAIIHPEATR